MNTVSAPARAVRTPRRRPQRRALIAIVAAAATLAVSNVVPLSPALADTRPADTAVPQTVSSDGLPTAQIGTGLAHEKGDNINGGVVWDQVVVGDVVYVGGDFQRARQPGDGADKAVERKNFLAYDLKTGALLDVNIPFNARVRSLAASPDGKRLYAAGSFTTVAGLTRYRIAAIDLTTGSVVSDFKPYLNSSAYTVAASATRVYVGGAFASAGKAEGFDRVASFTLDGQVDRAWNPKPRVDPKGVPNGMYGGTKKKITGSDLVQAIVVSPDGSKVVISGNFNSLNGSNPLDTNQSGYGMGMVRADNAQMLPWKVNKVVRNATSNSAVTSLSTDGEFVYGTGIWTTVHKGGNFEGTFKASWDDGRLDWVEDCHGDTYSAFSHRDVVYKASHAHACDTLGGFPERSNTASHGKWYRALALTKERTRTLTATPRTTYVNFAGNPAPSLLDWYPDLRVGTYTGMTQAAWDVTASGDYVLMAGEFVAVNGVSQAGLVRFASPDIAPNKQGPVLSGADVTPTVTGIQGTYVRLEWRANYDFDNGSLQYDVFRDGNTTTPVFTKTVRSNFYMRPVIKATDGYLAPGTTHTYRIRTSDPFGNQTWGETVSYTAPKTGALASDGQRSTYDSAVLADQPSAYWPMSESSGALAVNWAGTNHVNSLSARVPGAEVARNPKARAYSLSGTTWAATAAAEPTSATFTTELWFKTTTKTGGTLVAQTTKRDLTSAFDRAVYMDTAGRILFTATDGTAKAISTKGAFNDGRWHHLAVTIGASGTTIYVDGTARVSRADLRTGAMLGGRAFWAVGAHNLAGRHLAPAANGHFAGSLDNIASYNRPLTAAEVSAHYTAGVAKP
ncbi:concanavalin A-like lectin/glucanase superfamily protein [Labedella gwakjiensis]|uniref:Concanavalin A-like lectin/glucanase superfamily protein n=1 Tax=Labedella gwakjiensis TaxID=390269 RepID=A0A2P8GSK1_9MICO|nr:LamG domain-containing protein [Labedella gwakjiensis]PSL36949.1 concanavalin A-like lectin/glucanase superfamily protein [Labedella gwakjiensis]RUQ81747.1 LamG domain-containing protein [Labedella gwakjiensis]